MDKRNARVQASELVSKHKTMQRLTISLCTPRRALQLSSLSKGQRVVSTFVASKSNSISRPYSDSSCLKNCTQGNIITPWNIPSVLFCADEGARQGSTEASTSSRHNNESKIESSNYGGYEPIEIVFFLESISTLPVI